MNYFSNKTHISNSDLTELEYVLLDKKYPKNIEDIFLFGNIIDAMFTESERVDYCNKRFYINDNYIQIEPEIFEAAENIRKIALNDISIQRQIRNAELQYVVKRYIKCCWNNEQFLIPARGKLDLYIPQCDLIVDIKTTSCTTEKSFIKSLSYFNYDRQAAWYMDLTDVNKFMFRGFSKKNGKIFTHAITRNSVLYFSGLHKYSELAYQYRNLIINKKK